MTRNVRNKIFIAVRTKDTLIVIYLGGRRNHEVSLA